MHTPSRTISAGYTLVAKIVAVVWIVGFGLGTLVVVVRGERDGWDLMLAWLFGSAFLYWCALRLKKVTIDGDALRVSNYLMTVSMPLASIRDVTDASVLPGLQLLVIRLRSRSAFGEKIVFQPSSRSAVRALREALPQAQASDLTPNEV